MKKLLTILFMLAGCASNTGDPFDGLNPKPSDLRQTQTTTFELASCVGDLKILMGHPVHIRFNPKSLEDLTIRESPYLNSIFSYGMTGWLRRLTDELGTESFSVIQGERRPIKIKDQRVFYVELNGGITEYNETTSGSATKSAYGLSVGDIGIDLRPGSGISTDVAVIDLFARLSGAFGVEYRSSWEIAIQTKEREIDTFAQDGKGTGHAFSYAHTIGPRPHRAHRTSFERAIIDLTTQLLGIDVSRCERTPPKTRQNMWQYKTNFRRNSLSTRAIWMQTLLREEGYYTGAIDGEWGTQSRVAMLRFLNENGYSGAALGDRPLPTFYAILAMRSDLRRIGKPPVPYPASSLSRLRTQTLNWQ